MQLSRRLSLSFAVAFCAAACIFCLSAPAQAQRPLMTHHVRDVVINGQAPLVGLLPNTQQMSLAIMLPLRNEAELDSLLRDLYDPYSPLRGHYLTVPEFTARFGPTQQDYDTVVAFAKANGMTVTDLAPNRLTIELRASVGSVEKAFHVVLGTYQHPTENRIFYATDREPTVDLNVPLWHIAGLDNFSIPRPMYRKAAPGVKSNTTGSGPGGDFLGSDRRAAYYGGTALTGSGQSVGLFELDGYNLTDVNNYFTNVKQTRSVPINNVLLLGASGGSDGQDTEQVIDIIEAISMAPGMTEVLVYIAPQSTFEVGTSDAAIFSRMASDDIAKQLSVSWLWKPDDPSSDDTYFKEFASQGQSIFVASGDYGSYPNSYGYYYPAEDANVTGVGGTELTTVSAGGAWSSETAWGSPGNLCASGTGSGGGISPDDIPIPPYQQLSGVINSSNKGSTVYRNIPDVAAEANCDNYYCANGSCGEGLGGTSLATPTWAGFAALFNGEDVSNGEYTFGFLNPQIYQINTGSSYGTYFHDITSGSNGTYSAVTGYDLVTGWGSPKGSGWPLPESKVPLSCTATPSCSLEGSGPGEVVAGQVPITCNQATLLTASATICGNSCVTNSAAPPEPITSLNVGDATQGTGGSCSFSWTWGGNSYSQELNVN
jgi:subtilase family serine protease